MIKTIIFGALLLASFPAQAEENMTLSCSGYNPRKNTTEREFFTIDFANQSAKISNVDASEVFISADIIKVVYQASRSSFEYRMDRRTGEYTKTFHTTIEGRSISMTEIDDGICKKIERNIF